MKTNQKDKEYWYFYQRKVCVMYGAIKVVTEIMRTVNIACEKWKFENLRLHVSSLQNPSGAEIRPNRVSLLPIYGCYLDKLTLLPICFCFLATDML